CRRATVGLEQLISPQVFIPDWLLCVAGIRPLGEQGLPGALMPRVSASRASRFSLRPGSLAGAKEKVTRQAEPACQ
ncbi:hypothetical protein, partial [Stutzerimonas stutzeri]|uniref:hypothetical protein n=1 Tax=Stutzerimonas stutzeri TaxID=316 RepID=UPI0034D3C02E